MNFDFVWYLSLRDTDINQHLLLLYGLVLAIEAKTVLEIGAGQSTFALTAAVNQTKGQFYSIDLTKEARERLFPNAPDLDQEKRFHFLQGDSLKVVNKWDVWIDLLFIDSSHEYNQTLEELEKWTTYVKKGGFIVMHDTGEFNNNFVDCRRAMLDFLKDKNYEVTHLANQNGLSIIRKI